MERKRLVHQIDTPYSTVRWPNIRVGDQDVILELLCSLLSPLGAHRRAYSCPSRGKRSKAKQKALRTQEPTRQSPQQSERPPVPELARFVDIGLASVTRTLQDEACALAPAEAAQKPDPIVSAAGGSAPVGSVPPLPRRPPYVAVFVARAAQASAFHCHFPQMVAVASQSSAPGHSAIRLVGLGGGACEARLSECLGIPRVSCVALRAGAPMSQALIDFVQEKVAPIEVSWLQEAGGGHRETKINAIQTTVGPKRQRRS